MTLERDHMRCLQRDCDALEHEVGRRLTELNRSEDQLRFILEAGRFGTWTLDLANHWLTASDVSKETFGRRPGDPFSYGNLIDAILPQDRAPSTATIWRSIEQCTDSDIKFRLETPQGDIRWIEIRGQTFCDAAGAPLSLAGVMIDITERMQMEEHRELLAAELSHCVKSSIAPMQSIAHQTLRNATSLEEARATLDAPSVARDRA